MLEAGIRFDRRDGMEGVIKTEWDGQGGECRCLET